MQRSRTHRWIAAAMLGVLAITAQGALAQGIPIIFPWKWVQTWTKPLASHPSIVRDCNGQPITFLLNTAFDDFECQQTGPIVRVSWWGTSQIPTAPARRFYIAFWEHLPGLCNPTVRLYQNCVTANVRRVGKDCQNRTVWYYTAVLTPPFTQVAGNRYWLQISEVDDMSPSLNAVDFRWSAHRPIAICPAVNRNPVTGATNPLIDPCDNQLDDLAFRLYSRTVSGQITPVPTGRPGVYRICFRDPTTLELLESTEFSTDDEGNFYVPSDLPVGPYRAYMNGMAGLEQELTSEGLLILANNTNHDLGQIGQILGDVNGDDRATFADITALLSQFGRMGAVTP